MNATDSRVESAQALLTGRKLLAGHGGGLVRLPAVGRLLGVSIWNRPQLVAWIEAQGLWFVPPTTGPLADNPQAGTIDCNALREALQQGLAAPGGLPFAHNLEAKP